MTRRLAPTLALTAALLAGGCGASDDRAAPAALPETTTSAEPAPTPTPTSTPQPKPAASARPSVAPETVAPSTSDARSAAALDGWRGTVLAQLRRIDARLVTDSAATIRNVRETCEQMSTGLFETKVFPIIRERFSTPRITVTQAMAQDIYAVLLQDACYAVTD